MIEIKNKLDVINLNKALLAFYDVTTIQEIVIEQAKHIERLQEKLNDSRRPEVLTTNYRN
jgi:hypothetical protein